MKKFYFGILAVFILFLGCSFSGDDEEEIEAAGNSLVLMTWNVNNLFDGKDNGNEYDEFLEASGWSTEKYLGRINSISAAIGGINPVPDIILLQEIESLNVMEDLALSMFQGYSWSHFANNPGSAIGLGILSRVPLSEHKVHSITIGGDTTPRPVLETRVDTDEMSFVIFTCHWKSKIGGDEVTENVRKASARVILRRIRELWKTEPELGIVIAGDLNENHNEFYSQNSNIICALMPDDPFSVQLTGCSGAETQKDFIVIGKNRPPEPVNFPQDTITLFSPWTDELENGSYFYKNNWEAIDHFLISAHFFGGGGWKYKKAILVNASPFANNSGTPFTYNAKTGTGLSDHFPLLIELHD